MTHNRIPLLDHGHIQIVDSMGGDLSVVRSARVSHNADWRSGENEGSDARLIKYLWKNKHTSPFESVIVSVEVQAPLFIFREWHRHRTQSYNEISARYTELPALFYIPTVERVGMQDPKNKQGTVPTVDPAIRRRREAEIQELEQHCLLAFELYQKFLASGQPRECARFILPINTYSRMFATSNLLNWFRFLTLRTASNAQWEIQAYAFALLALLRPIAPISVAAFEECP